MACVNRAPSVILWLVLCTTCEAQTVNLREIAAFGPIDSAQFAEPNQPVTEPALAVGGGKVMTVFQVPRVDSTNHGQRIGYSVRDIASGTWTESLIPYYLDDENPPITFDTDVLSDVTIAYEGGTNRFVVCAWVQVQPPVNRKRLAINRYDIASGTWTNTTTQWSNAYEKFNSPPTQIELDKPWLVAGDPDDKELYLLASDGVTGRDRFVSVRSRDGGATWGTAEQIKVGSETVFGGWGIYPAVRGSGPIFATYVKTWGNCDPPQMSIHRVLRGTDVNTPGDPGVSWEWVQANPSILCTAGPAFGPGGPGPLECCTHHSCVYERAPISFGELGFLVASKPWARLGVWSTTGDTANPNRRTSPITT